MTELSGQVDLNQRKGKLITIFDFAVDLEWKGTFGDIVAEGKIMIPEYMHDSELDDIVFDVTTSAETKEKEKIKDVLKKNLLPLIRESFSTFNDDLMKENKGDIQGMKII
jgi:activator of HSP90 ATPase